MQIFWAKVKDNFSVLMIQQKYYMQGSSIALLTFKIRSVTWPLCVKANSMAHFDTYSHKLDTLTLHVGLHNS